MTFDLPAGLPYRLTIISNNGVSQYTQGDQTLFEDPLHCPPPKPAHTYASGAFTSLAWTHAADNLDYDDQP